jgi:hypothetical protein
MIPLTLLGKATSFLVKNVNFEEIPRYFADHNFSDPPMRSTARPDYEDLVYGGELSAEAVQRLFLPNQQKVWMADGHWVSNATAR